MQYPKIPLAQSILTICKKKNIQHIVISPGSRNAPLTIGFASDPFFKCFSIADERCAAFFGLGLAQQLKQPVALVCTSGSALLNYYPAVAEAFYSQIPLVVISADRPTSKIDIGDGQTIRQANVYNNHILFNANLSEDASVANDFLINQAINKAITNQGPVHINAPFEEPLYDVVDELVVNPSINQTNLNIAVDAVNFEELDSKWTFAKKKLVLIGVQDANVLSDAVLNYLASDSSVVVMTEVTSNAKNKNFIGSIDSLITTFSEEQFKLLQPDVLITLGGMVVSKRIKKFLRTYKPQEHWHIDPLRAYDTFGALTKHIKITPDKFFNRISKRNVVSKYQQTILSIYADLRNKQRKFTLTAPYSDLKVFEAVATYMPDNVLLHVSNSSAIRYAQLFDYPQNVAVYCNRGTSGIDGCTSTAIGAAVLSNKKSVLITGDVSFLYDSNALWNNYTPNNFKIIVLNNGGGGIFRILPGHQETEVFNTYFETQHKLTAQHLAQMYGYQYTTCSELADLDKLKAFFESETKQIIEIFTPTTVNDKVLKEYFKIS
ncbi:2-succinyl-5-enolpyruvyl-6-hydroxy-3-cyclohexene-1-carboxylic-acid synthase [Flavobacterium agricola]|uniref:2-succinyl-5-enolpyruvyl-6-hydroxy-3-cyclohexene-1-carboxylate synthase n=1 Tax=Flavobacterium agricola TaxID=2870839 RepID=A0ABY6M487_9FLAO|nr:2-succinyl-5-enolpyruvyl-6-hydroxy-3-cyclohexene-1-carboxylic-acid synthase [Flavobacterium agricola]UYW02425.1 2-succinyl-5-enolpyruvyl-6-hydroxy-3-cyclohexene-1-carboxylic-acid synthase [Flavobacterium agricola]